MNHVPSNQWRSADKTELTSKDMPLEVFVSSERLPAVGAENHREAEFESEPQ
jgi:hypothetical protein